MSRGTSPVPAGYDAAVAHPLVIVYHGWRLCLVWEEYLGQGLGSMPATRKVPVAYPQGAYRPSRSRPTGAGQRDERAPV